MDKFYIYLIIINIAAFAAFGADKSRAKSRGWRIPEATLMFFAIIGGSAGALIGMYIFRHKTRHVKFAVGIPLVLIIEAAAYWYFFIR